MEAPPAKQQPEAQFVAYPRPMRRWGNRRPLSKASRQVLSISLVGMILCLVAGVGALGLVFFVAAIIWLSQRERH